VAGYIASRPVWGDPDRAGSLQAIDVAMDLVHSEIVVDDERADHPPSWTARGAGSRQDDREDGCGMAREAPGGSGDRVGGPHLPDRNIVGPAFPETDGDRAWMLSCMAADDGGLAMAGRWPHLNPERLLRSPCAGGWPDVERD
jgi:hypothetical protein